MVTPRRAPQIPNAGPLIRPADPGGALPDVRSQQVGALGESLVQAGVAGYKLTSQMLEDLDDAKFQDASSKYADLLSNAENNLGQIKGLEAEEAFNTQKDSLSKQRAEIEKGLTSDRQKRRFKLDADARDRNSLGRMFRYSGEQLRVARVAKTTGSLSAAKRARVDAAIKGDVSAYLLHSMESATKLKQLAELNGLDAEQIKQAQEQFEQNVVSEITQTLIDTDAIDRAQSFAESNEKSLGGALMAKFNTQFETANKNREAILLAQDYMPSATSMVDARRYANDLLRKGSKKGGITADQYTVMMSQFSASLREQGHQKEVHQTNLLTRATDLRMNGDVVPPRLQAEMEELGIWFEWERTMRHNPDRKTTAAGERFKFQMLSTPSLFDGYSSPEQIYLEWGADLSPADLDKIATKWQARLEERFDGAAEGLVTGKGGSRLRASRFIERPGSPTQRPQAFSPTATDVDDMIYLGLKEVAPGLAVTKENLNKLTGREDTGDNWMRFQRIKQAVLENVENQMAATPGATKATREMVQQAIDDVVRVTAKVDGGEERFYYGLSPTDREDYSRLRLNLGPTEIRLSGIPSYEGPETERVDQLTLMPTQLAAITETGGDPEATKQAVMRRMQEARTTLVGAQMQLLREQDGLSGPTTLEQEASYLARAQVMVSERDVFEFLGRGMARLGVAQKLVDEQIARRDPVDQALAQYNPVAGLSTVDPDERTKSSAISSIESMWASWSSRKANDGTSETDAEWFVESFRDFEFAFRGRLQDVTKDIPEGFYRSTDPLDQRPRSATSFVRPGDRLQPNVVGVPPKDATEGYNNAKALADVIFGNAPEELRIKIAEHAAEQDVNGFREELTQGLFAEDGALDEDHAFLLQRHAAVYSRLQRIVDEGNAHRMNEDPRLRSMWKTRYFREPGDYSPPYRKARRDLYKIEQKLREKEGRPELKLTEKELFRAGDAWGNPQDIRRLRHIPKVPREKALSQKALDLLTTKRNYDLRNLKK